MCWQEASLLEDKSPFLVCSRRCLSFAVMARSGIHSSQCLPHLLQSPAGPTSRGHLTAPHSLSHPHPLQYFSCKPRLTSRTLVDFLQCLAVLAGRGRCLLLSADSWKQGAFLESIFESQSGNFFDLWPFFSLKFIQE